MENNGYMVYKWCDWQFTKKGEVTILITLLKIFILCFHKLLQVTWNGIWQKKVKEACRLSGWAKSWIVGLMSRRMLHPGIKDGCGSVMQLISKCFKLINALGFRILHLSAEPYSILIYTCTLLWNCPFFFTYHDLYECWGSELRIRHCNTFAIMYRFKPFK